MVFASAFFVFLFLPAALLIALVFRKKYANVTLFATSFFFYFWSENWYIGILLFTALVDYVAGLGIAGALSNRKPIEKLERHGRRTHLQRTLLLISIAVNLTTLGFFKYTEFGIRNFNMAMGLIGLESLQLDIVFKVLLPLGISFYTFQSLSYTFDVYLGDTKATRNVIDYLTYILMFPQLVAGPIVRYRDVERELRSRTVTLDDYAYGVRRFIIGLGKKVLVANTLAVPVNRIFDIPFSQLTPGLAWLGVFAFTLQMYYDFSGYSDMAIGIGRILGFRFKENFRYPFISTSATEYFQRWHISLNTWLRDYPYRAMGGSRGSAFRVYFNVITLLVLVGLWHGASWNFIFWGLVCGLYLAIQRYMIRNNLRVPLALPLKIPLSFVTFMIPLAFFRSDSVSQALVFITGMFGFASGSGVEYHASLYLDAKVVICLLLGTIGSLPLVPWIVENYERLREKASPASKLWIEIAFRILRFVLIAALFALSALTLVSESHNPFIYFRF